MNNSMKNTERKALKEIKDRLIFFCAKTDGTYNPSWVKELIEIIDEGLGKKSIIKHKSPVAYKSLKFRAKSDKSRSWLSYTYGAYSGKPFEDTTMKGLASSIAYYYHRHVVVLYVSEDGKRFKKADCKMQQDFNCIMNKEFEAKV